MNAKLFEKIIKKKMRFILSAVIACFIFANVVGVQHVKAQTANPTDQVPTNSSDISDSQLRDFAQKAQASGMSDEQIRQAAIAKGMSETEINQLQSRINTMRSAKSDNQTVNKTVVDRKNNSDDEFKTSSAKVTANKTEPMIFGSELFNNTNLTFEPNLRIPTPQNYRLGPDDQLIVSIYGNSVAEWKPNVTPDGNVQLPGIGLVNVSGKTIEQATGLISAKLIANHYAIGHGTNLSVALGNIRSIKVIMVGEIVKPGTITVSSLSTVFNALYLSGGPNANGSFRQIEVIRDNAVIRKLDVYDFLLKANQKDNIRLQDGDIIRVPTYKVRVTLTGQIKRPALYEVLPGETLHDVINFAGGFTDLAYTANIKATQLTERDRKVTDIKADDFNNYIPLRGDSYVVDKILDTYENRVAIYGAVLRPGQYELDKGLTLSQLIAKASGLRQDAFTSRGLINRLKSDNTSEMIAFDVKAILNKTAPDIVLKKEDVVNIASIFDLRDEYTVTINGEVRNGGDFAYSDKMTVEDLIVQAGGLSQAGNPTRIEIARRVMDSDPNKKNTPVAQLFTINVDEQFKVNASSFILQPYDVVSVYTLPGFEKQKTVQIEGEVLYPGTYTIKTKDEKISDLIKRAGGLTASADVDGGRLKRTDNFGIDTSKSKVSIGEVNQERTDRLARIQKTLKDSTTNIYEQLRNDYVGVDLRKILSKPGSDIDLVLQEGDVLRIPKQQQLVKVSGEVLFPSSVVYSNSKTLAGFVNSAGGFSPNALRSRAYVVYANGSVKATHNFLFIKSYPEIRPGSQVVIPKKPVRKGLSASEISAMAGTLASAAAVLIGVISLVRK